MLRLFAFLMYCSLEEGCASETARLPRNVPPEVARRLQPSATSDLQRYRCAVISGSTYDNASHVRLGKDFPAAT